VAVPFIAIVLASSDDVPLNSAKTMELTQVAGLPMIEYALRNAEALSPSKIFVTVGPGSTDLVSYLGKRALPVRLQARQGSAGAVRRVLPFLKGFRGNLLILYADDCLTRPESVLALRQFQLLQKSEAALLTARIENPFRYGRIVRGGGDGVERIVQEDDATEEIRRIKEVNAGVYLFQAPSLFRALKALGHVEGGKDLSITEAIPHVIEGGGRVQALMLPDRSEVLGISHRGQLSWAHRILNLRRVQEHQRRGVTFLNPQTVEVGPEVLIGRDTVIEGNVRISGEAVIGKDCLVESGSVLHNVKLGRAVVIKSSRIYDSRLGDGCDAGPFAHVRGGCRLDKNVHVGTNAELKGSRVGSGSKVGHFSYVGDAKIGRNVNVGAGCVFANFDGKRKHETLVADQVFLGSNSTLVAPVRIGKGAVVGAGAVVTKDVPAGLRVAGVPARPMKKGK